MQQSEGGKKKNQLFYWGNDLVTNNKYMCVIPWASRLSTSIGFRDGFKYTSPVGYYGANSLGIFDMAILVMFERMVL